jgi:hypothetical protein
MLERELKPDLLPALGNTTAIRGDGDAAGATLMLRSLTRPARVLMAAASTMDDTLAGWSCHRVQTGWAVHRCGRVGMGGGVRKGKGKENQNKSLYSMFGRWSMLGACCLHTHLSRNVAIVWRQAVPVAVGSAGQLSWRHWHGEQDHRNEHAQHTGPQRRPSTCVSAM